MAGIFAAETARPEGDPAGRQDMAHLTQPESRIPTPLIVTDTRLNS